LFLRSLNARWIFLSGDTYKSPISIKWDKRVLGTNESFLFLTRTNESFQGTVG
jgi:hypothetical protein